jgi:hypothetical protein
VISPRKKIGLRMEVSSVPSEYFIHLCFIRPELSEPTEPTNFVETLQEEARLLFPTVSSLYVDRKCEEDLEIVVCELNGLSLWETEEEVLLYMEERLSEEWLSLLAGYKIQVIPKEDAGTCSLKQRV